MVAKRSESHTVVKALLVPWLVSLPIAGYLTGAYVETAYGRGKFLIASSVAVLLLVVAAAATDFFSLPYPVARQEKIVGKAMTKSALVLYPTLLVAFLALNQVLPPRLAVPHEAPAVTILGAIYVPLAWLVPVTALIAWIFIRRASGTTRDDDVNEQNAD
jgi:hypothetical protein